MQARTIDAETWRRSGASRSVVEMGALVALATAYTLIRAAQGTNPAQAIHHSHLILQIQGPAITHAELAWNHWLAGIPALAVPACYFYALFHYAATPLILYLSWRHGGWIHTRGYWTLIIASAIGLLVYATFAAAPPRLMPDLHTIDVMRKFASYGWWSDAASAPRGIGDATNQYAAMPSLHFGWSLWCAVQMWSFAGRHLRWWRTAAIAYPTLQVLVVIGTGNHFLLDVLGGAACVGLALLIVSLAGRRSARALSVRQRQESRPER
ncbi:MAG: phosphatase PAP2 family protein [Nocardioides sp.]|uniref:phosphatase PAP2 family protein n=1 Tax=Nocardioides sp. TaxID=35761 RepID=UPI0039E39C7A